MAVKTFRVVTGSSRFGGAMKLRWLKQIMNFDVFLGTFARVAIAALIVGTLNSLHWYLTKLKIRTLIPLLRSSVSYPVDQKVIIHSMPSLVTIAGTGTSSAVMKLISGYKKIRRWKDDECLITTERKKALCIKDHGPSFQKYRTIVPRVLWT